MIIKELLAELETKDHPVAKPLYKAEGFKVLVLAFKKGMVLKEHKAHVPTKLVVLNGKVIYKSDANEITLDKYDEFEIPINDLHTVDALDDALCMLIQG
jgi:quercetin dioxygenase-like cupin family protein